MPSSSRRLEVRFNGLQMREPDYSLQPACAFRHLSRLLTRLPVLLRTEEKRHQPHRARRKRGRPALLYRGQARKRNGVVRLEHPYPLGRHERPVPAGRKADSRQLRMPQAAGGDEIPVCGEHKGPPHCGPGVPRPAGTVQLCAANQHGVQQVRPPRTRDAQL